MSLRKNKNNILKQLSLVAPEMIRETIEYQEYMDCCMDWDNITLDTPLEQVSSRWGGKRISYFSYDRTAAANDITKEILKGEKVRLIDYVTKTYQSLPPTTRIKIDIVDKYVKYINFEELLTVINDCDYLVLEWDAGVNLTSEILQKVPLIIDGENCSAELIKHSRYEVYYLFPSYYLDPYRTTVTMTNQLITKSLIYRDSDDIPTFIDMVDIGLNH